MGQLMNHTKGEKIFSGRTGRALSFGKKLETRKVVDF